MNGKSVAAHCDSKSIFHRNSLLEREKIQKAEAEVSSVYKSAVRVLVYIIESSNRERVSNSELYMQ